MVELKKEIITKLEAVHRWSHLTAEYNMIKSKLLGKKTVIKLGKVAKDVKSLSTKQSTQTMLKSYS